MALKFFLTLFFFILIGNMAFSQNLNITGKVVDENGAPLESATIYVEKIKDSVLVAYSISDRSGDFTLKGDTEEKSLNMHISYAGYQPFHKTITVSDSIVLDVIKLQVENNELNEVVVTGSAPPIVIKKDTVEFNAASFATRPDANLEDLLKKLPGAEVDSDGAVTINGKPVSRILVNGKEFFGNDPLIATKNLPKDIINKVQVVDTKTEAEAFTGKAGDSDNKTINVTIKKDRNKGYFARATAGKGTDERYELSGIGNFFKDEMRLSILGSANNINSTGFSYDDVYGMMGRRGASAIVGGGNNGGITESSTAGLNYTNEWDKKYELNTDYFFGRNSTETASRVNRENILPDNRYYSNSDNESHVDNDSHRANLRFEIKFDSLTQLSFSPRLNMNFSKSIRTNETESLDENLNPINTSNTLDQEEVDRVNFSNAVDLIRRFGKRGAYVRLDFSHSHNKQENDNFYYSESTFFDESESRLELQDQFIEDDTHDNSYSVGIEQRSVLAEDLFLDASYDYSAAVSEDFRYVYDKDETENYSLFNEELSNDYEVKTKRHTPRVGLNYEGEIWDVRTSFGLLNTQLENTNLIEETSFKNTYNNVYVSSRIRYEIQRSENISLDYNTSANTPSVRQLQPVTDRTNPLNIVAGNPELMPQFTHNIRLGYRKFNFADRTGIFGNFSLVFNENSIVSVTTVNEDLVKYTTYTNVDGGMSSSLGGNFSKSYKKDAKEFRYRVGVNGSYRKNVGYTNGVLFNSENFSVSPSFNFTYALEKIIEINPNYRLSYNKSRYDINASRNNDFVNHNLGVQVTTYWPKNMVFGNDLSYSYNGNVSPGFDNTSILWNLSLGYQFLKEKANVKIKIYDLLDQNVDTRRVIGDDYIQDVNSLILKRYAMLSLTYKLSNFGGSSPGGNGDRRGPMSGRRF